MKNLIVCIILFLICILSRMFSALNYVEDPESMQFTLCILDKNVLTCPDSLLFAFLVKILFLFIPNLSLAFSVIGGTAVFLLIFFVLRIVNAPLLSLEGGITSLLIFFNPLIWIMSNHYSPDTLGVALLTASLYFLLADTCNSGNLSSGWLLLGLLAGIKPLFIFVLIIPAVFSLLNGRKFFPFLFFFVGLGIWTLPVILNGRRPEDIMSYDFIFGMDPVNNLYEIIKSIWAYGLGGYWPQRNLFLILSSLALLICLFFGTLILLDYGLSRKKLLALAAGFFTYVLVLLFSDLSNEFNALLPFIPFFCILIAYGIIYFIINFNHISVKICMGAFLLINLSLTIAQVIEHKKPSALAQTKDYLEEYLNSGNRLLIISDPQVAGYLSGEIKADYCRTLSVNPAGSVLISIDVPLAGRKVKNHLTFHHDPLINSHRPVVDLYEY